MNAASHGGAASAVRAPSADRRRGSLSVPVGPDARRPVVAVEATRVMTVLTRGPVGARPARAARVSGRRGSRMRTAERLEGDPGDRRCPSWRRTSPCPTAASKDLDLFGYRCRRNPGHPRRDPHPSPAERSAWYLFAAANICFVLGDGVYDIYDLVLHRETPFPSIADALYLAGYPLLFAGVVRVNRRRGPGLRESRTDAAMVSVAALALSWQFLMGSYAHDTTLTQFAKLVTMAYPVLDIGLLFIVVSAMMNRSAPRPTDKLIALALSLTLVSDFIYDLLVLHSSYTAGNPVDAGFLLNYVVMAAAAAASERRCRAPLRTRPDRRGALAAPDVAARRSRRVRVARLCCWSAASPGGTSTPACSPRRPSSCPYWSCSARPGCSGACGCRPRR